MFFVDDHESEILELNVRLNEFVRADDEINFALGHALQRGLDFLWRSEARELFNANRPRRKAILERVVVLLGQQCRRHQ